MSSLKEYIFSDYLEEDEEILFVAHRHLFAFLPDIFRVLVFHGLLPAGFWYLFPQLLGIYVIWGAIGFVRILLVIQDWYYDAWLITNMGVVGVEWTGYFNRSSSRVEYQSIEGINCSITGVIQTIFNYGDITLSKLGGPTTVTLKDAYRPKRVEKNLVAYQEKFVTNKNFMDQEVLKKLLSDLVVEHIKKHGIPEVEKSQGQGQKISK